MKFKPMACGFHSHTDQSLDGASTPEAKILYADKLGRIADCVTDHGVMNALAPHWLAAKKLAKSKKTSKKIQSIHGIEAYVIDDIRGPKTYKNGKIESRYFHLTIHFKTAAAYQYFCSLTPIMEDRAIVKYDERKPLIRLEELEPIAGQITIGSGCVTGAVQKFIIDWSMTREERYAQATRMYEKLRHLAGPGNFFVEVFPHTVDKNWKRPVYDKKDKKKQNPTVAGYFEPIFEKNHVCGTHCDGVEHVVDECGHKTVATDIQREANQFVIAMAKKYGDPIIISEDSHFAQENEQLVQSCRLGNGTENWRFSSSYHMGTSDEWATVLQANLGVSDRDIEEWIDNSYMFVDKFKDYSLVTADERILLPTMEMVYNVTGSTRDKFWEMVRKHNKMPAEDHPEYQTYKSRIDYELSVLCDNKTADFLPYLFLLEDAAEYARKNDITFTCRGSAGGSLAVYLLNISITDPIVYDLPFERFITLGRIESGSLPDVDTDWENRDLILKYLFEKYGDKIAQISTNLLLRMKSSIKDVERATLGSVQETTEKMLRGISPPQGTDDRDWLFGYFDKTTGENIPGFLQDKEDPFAQQLREYSEKNKDIWDVALKCIGITRGKGVHAGGVVLAQDAIANHMPLIHTKEGIGTGYEMKGVEAVGGVKYDFLSVDALDVCGAAMRSVRERYGLDLRWKEFPYDPKVFENVIHAGRLAGIFQINTATVMPYLLRIKPKTISEIAITTALIRPGALDAPSPDPKDPYTGGRNGDDSNIHAAEYFVRVREGRKKPYYIHPDLEPILSETYGTCIFQEQSLKIFRDIVGYSYAEAEEVRRAIGKKNKELMDKHLGVLRVCCLSKNWTEEQVDQLVSTLIASANYSFNKSHACLPDSEAVLTSRGPKKISELTIADKIAYIDSSGKLDYETPEAIFCNGSKEVLEIEFEDGSIIRLTPDHRVWHKGDWVEIKEIIARGEELDGIDWETNKNFVPVRG